MTAKSNNAFNLTHTPPRRFSFSFDPWMKLLALVDELRPPQVPHEAFENWLHRTEPDGEGPWLIGTLPDGTCLMIERRFNESPRALNSRWRRALRYLKAGWALNQTVQRVVTPASVSPSAMVSRSTIIRRSTIVSRSASRRAAINVSCV